MTWQQVVGKVLPWAVAAVTGLFEALGMQITWWPTAGALLIGAVQLIIGLIPAKRP